MSPGSGRGGKDAVVEQRRYTPPGAKTPSARRHASESMSPGASDSATAAGGRRPTSSISPAHPAAVGPVCAACQVMPPERASKIVRRKCPIRRSAGCLHKTEPQTRGKDFNVNLTRGTTQSTTCRPGRTDLIPKAGSSGDSGSEGRS